MAYELIKIVKDSHLSGYKILGVITDKKDIVAKFPGLKVFPTFEEALEKIKISNIHSIVQTELYANNDKNNGLIDFAQKNHISFRFIPGNTEMFIGNIEVDLFKQSLPVVAVHQTALIGWGRIIKRIFDLFVSLILVVITSPITLLVATLELFSGGDVFFRQERLTRYNNVFRVYKFRTVRPAYNGLSPEEAFAKMGRPELIKKYRDNGDYLPNDPRYGRFGNFLRRTSLDELPQLFNILKGDISLVGPRALIPQELSVYEKGILYSALSPA